MLTDLLNHLNTIIVTLGGSGSAGLLAYIFKEVKAYIKRKEEAELKATKERKTKLDNIEAQQELQRLALLAMLHDSIYNEGARYLDQGFITPDQLDNFNKLYQPYQAMGGNSTGHTMSVQVNQLAIRDKGGSIVEQTKKAEV